MAEPNLRRHCEDIASFRERAMEYLDKVGDAHRARMTWHLALALATVTLIGYAFQTKRSEVIVLAACITFFQFLSDIFLKKAVIMPLLYKALVYDHQSKESEPLSLLMLDFVGAESSQYGRLVAIRDERLRRKRFQKRFVMRHLILKSTIFGTVLMVEFGLFLWIGALP